MSECKTVISGWKIERTNTGIIVQHLSTGIGYSASREGESGVAEVVLAMLAEDLILQRPGSPHDQRRCVVDRTGVFVGTSEDAKWDAELKRKSAELMDED